MSSILTNNSAIVALQTIKSINSNLTKTQSEISTGKSIATAKDNAAIWGVSKVMEGEAAAFKTIQSNLNAAGAVVSTARVGAEAVVDGLTDIKKLVSGATSDLMDADAREKTTQEITRKLEQIKSTIDTTQMNGVNMLSNGDSFKFLGGANHGVEIGDDTGHYITVAGVNLTAEMGLDFDAGLDISDTAKAAEAMKAIDDALNAAIVGAATLGSTGKRIEDQSKLASQMADSLKVGVGALVDADMEEASARLQALQTQQQLGIQALSIANQAPQSILSLFR
ncbi:MAG: flagellin [Paracoccus sp. (in: a-proteobacteria)]|uniref:flagellin N-terminal helical domain-containing protein n=1 Tax=Paracoccus sp. TaxID=267 RepID=UPI0026DEF270|nr:flagellin [Paracoccus sp. (in: a-proteobacteria)]MDO5631693.1 flagellin [Paracoccus sp. (in: a-proteobacteria)]